VAFLQYIVSGLRALLYPSTISLSRSIHRSIRRIPSSLFCILASASSIVFVSHIATEPIRHVPSLPPLLSPTPALHRPCLLIRSSLGVDLLFSTLTPSLHQHQHYGCRHHVRHCSRSNIGGVGPQRSTAELLWINLIMDTFATLALATDQDKKTDPLFTVNKIGTSTVHRTLAAAAEWGPGRHIHICVY
jgi:hypothetical protein